MEVWKPVPVQVLFLRENTTGSPIEYLGTWADCPQSILLVWEKTPTWATSGNGVDGYEIRSHHFDSMVETVTLVGICRGNRIIAGFLGWCRISSIDSRSRWSKQLRATSRW